jgi:hypothetical protein
MNLYETVVQSEWANFDTFPIKNDLQQGDTLLQLLYKFALDIQLSGLSKIGGIEIEFYTLGSGSC